MRLVKKLWRYALLVVVTAAVSVPAGIEADRKLFPPKPVEHTIYLFLPQGFTIA